LPAALLIVKLGAPFRIRGGSDTETAAYTAGCVVTTPTRALEFGYALWTRPSATRWTAGRCRRID